MGISPALQCQLLKTRGHVCLVHCSILSSYSRGWYIIGAQEMTVEWLNELWMNLVPTLHLVLMEDLMGSPRQLGSWNKGQGEVNEFHHVAWDGNGRPAQPRQQLMCLQEPPSAKGLQGIQDGLIFGCQWGTEVRGRKRKMGQGGCWVGWLHKRFWIPG